MTLSRNNRGRTKEKIEIGNHKFQVMSSFKYLGAIYNNSNDIKEEIIKKVQH